MPAVDFVPVINFFNNQVMVSDLAYRAYRMARALKHPGQGLSQSESAEALQILNSMVDGFKAERLMVEYERRTIQDMHIGQKSYGVGPGQDFDLERPERIDGAGFIVPGNGDQIASPPAEIPMEIYYSFEQYQRVIVKDVQSQYPLILYYNAAAPYGQVLVWPVPNIEGQIAIYTPQLLSEFQTLDVPFYARDGVREMIQYNLAMAVHEHYPEKQIAPSIELKAMQYKGRVKANQFVPLYIKSDDGANQGNSRQPWWGGYPKTYVPFT